MSLNNDYVDFQWLDRKGASHDLSFLRNQADLLIRQHLNETIKTFQYVDIGYNNLIFFIDTVESTEQYVLKVGGRYWVSSKTEDEVKALQLLAEHTTIPVPRILAYSLDDHNDFGVGWILMTRLPGESMLRTCESRSMSVTALRSIIEDLADFIAQMHFHIPRQQQIGTFRLDGQIDVDSNGLGPWSTFGQYVRDRARLEIRTIEKHPAFAPIRETLLRAIDEFDRLHFSQFANLPFVFSHGDLHIQNILISVENPEAPRVTGLVDWEWCGSLPCSEEYFTLFDYFKEHDDGAILQTFYDALEKRNVPTPRTIERFSSLEKINRFLTTLEFWELPSLSDPDDPIAMKKIECIGASVVSLLEDLKVELGFETDRTLTS